MEDKREVKKSSSRSYIRADYVIEKKACHVSKHQKKAGARKRGNGRGTVEKTKNKLNPFKAKVPVEVYVDKNGKSQVKYKSIGLFPTKGLADEALAEYNRTPYDLSSKISTFQDLYKAWSAEYFETLSSESSIRTVTSAYAYCSGLYYMKIRQIGVGHIKDAMNHGYVIVTRGKNKGQRKYASPCTQERIKSMCNLMFDYALERNLVLTNPARAFKIDKLLQEIEVKAKKKKPFTDSDVRLLWEYYEMIPFADIILVGIYTGFRPQELVLIRTENVFLEEGYFIGGMKTSNGTDRMVPIHPKIKDLVKFRYQQATELYHSEFLFNISCGSSYKPFTYDTYELRFHNVMAALNLEGFTPHCTRHTFASKAETCGLRNRAIKLIMGHSLKGDVTDYHYKHTGYEYLYDEICKIDFEEGADGYEGYNAAVFGEEYSGYCCSQDNGQGSAVCPAGND